MRSRTPSVDASVASVDCRRAATGLTLRCRILQLVTPTWDGIRIVSRSMMGRAAACQARPIWRVMHKSFRQEARLRRAATVVTEGLQAFERRFEQVSS